MLDQDQDTQIIAAGSSRKETDEIETSAKILEFLTGHRDASTGSEIEDAIEGRTLLIRKGLRRLFDERKVSRIGGGKKGDPYLYSVCGFPVPTYIREQENKKPEIGLNDSKKRTNACSRKTSILTLLSKLGNKKTSFSRRVKIAPPRGKGGQPDNPGRIWRGHRG